MLANGAGDVVLYAYKHLLWGHLSRFFAENRVPHVGRIRRANDCGEDENGSWRRRRRCRLCGQDGLSLPTK